MDKEHRLDIASKSVRLNLDDMSHMRVIAHALSAEPRLRILMAINYANSNINELARTLDLPVSSVALHVNVLEKAGLIATEMQPGIRGSMRICTRRIDQITFDLDQTDKEMLQFQELEIPVGCYSLVGDVKSTCGLAYPDQAFCISDNPSAFYHPSHFKAQLLWMREGFVEYHVPLADIDFQKLDYIEVSFEACAETYAHNNHWPSDIFLALNGQSLGVWRCPGDFGGRRGRLNPPWWGDVNTQYGQLNVWKINRQGAWLNNDYLSGATLDQLDLKKQSYLSLRIGVLTQRGLSGGMNLFGREFGDSPQDIVVKYGYRR